VDLRTLRDGLNTAVPFSRHVGIELTALEPGRCEAHLPDRSELHNHVDSQHAGALFTLADAASGGAFAAAMGERIAHVRPLVRRATIDYTKVARGAITARAAVEDLDRVLAVLDRDGRVDIPVQVSMFDGEENEVACVRIEWNVKQPPAGEA
jgi:uncharacterized protein (TIGR00369 family)